MRWPWSMSSDISATSRGRALSRADRRRLSANPPRPQRPTPRRSPLTALGLARVAGAAPALPRVRARPCGWTGISRHAAVMSAAAEGFRRARHDGRGDHRPSPTAVTNETDDAGTDGVSCGQRATRQAGGAGADQGVMAMPDPVPARVREELAALPAPTQAAFHEAYRRRARSTATAYVICLLVGGQYGYVGRWALQI